VFKGPLKSSSYAKVSPGYTGRGGSDEKLKAKSAVSNMKRIVVWYAGSGATRWLHQKGHEQRDRGVVEAQSDRARDLMPRRHGSETAASLRGEC
jgi:hypothetical protein